LPDLVCSAVSLAFDEPLWATASMVRNWVLIEHPGAWGPAALTESGLPEHLTRGLAARARRNGFRVLLIRRPVRPTDGSRQCFVAHSGRRRRWIEERRLTDLDELLDLDFSPLSDGEPLGFGAPRDAPLYLVCTNGRHDQCCANLGRPVARALHARNDGSTWESSHYGGDRFAGNLVCLPHGLYYGRLSPADAVAAVEGYETGTVDLEHYRGRAGEPFAAQAAEHFLRQREGLVGVDDLLVTAYRASDHGLVRVTFAGAGGRSWDVGVQVRPAAEARTLSCGAGTEGRPPTYALVDMNAAT
jgi:hypothetical protein